MEQIDRGSPVPPWKQIRNFYQQQILNGIWPSGHRLPSILDACEVWGVAPVTERKARAWLQAQGFIITSDGMGTFVSARSHWGVRPSLVAAG